MAQVTYRGVVYDTDRNKAKQTNKVDLTYRGVRTEKELTSLKVIETLEICIASAIFLTIITAEVQFLYKKG